MAVSSFFLKGLMKILNDEIQLTTDNLKVALVGTDYVFDNESEFFDTGVVDVNNPKNEALVATSYVPQALPSDPLFAISLTGDGSVLMAVPDINFGVIGGATNDTVHGAILYKDTGLDTTSPVIAFIPIDTPTATTGVLFNADFNTTAEGANLVIGLPDQTGGS